MKARNPNRPVVRETQEQWYKLCALVMFKSGEDSVRISVEDIEAFAASGKANIVIHPRGDVITLSLVTDEKAKRLRRKRSGT